MRKIIRNFLQLESASGIVLLGATIVAMLWANSPFYPIYKQFTNNWHFFINEMLMSAFFLLVGLELKRGVLDKQFSKTSDLLLPLAAAFGGMLVPASIYLMFNHSNPETVNGWATPVATDIAFALGVLTLVGSGISKSLKLFLLSIAIFDDIGAILIIAIFYSHSIEVVYLLYAAAVIVGLLVLNAYKFRALAYYLLGGAVLWYLFLRAGIHPTLAGVLTAFLIPELPLRRNDESPVHSLETKLHPYVAFGIMPLFALANAGISIQQITWSMWLEPVVLGIIFGLFIGKQLGVLGVTWLCMKTTRWAALPSGASWLQLYGMALLCGIGFTMSLFLGTLSFNGQSDYIYEVRLGVMAGSLLSGLAGAGVLWLANKRSQPVAQS